MGVPLMKEQVSLFKPEKKAISVDKNTWLHLFAGGAGGFVGTIIFSPLEVIKTRFQSSLYNNQMTRPVPTANLFQTAKFHVNDTLNAIRKLYLTEGGRALFKGLGPTLTGVVPSRSIAFFSYGNGKALFTNWNGGKENSLVHLSAASCAGVITATVTNPIWVVRTRMQLQSESARAYRNSIHCIYQIIKNEGVKSLYRGMSASYLGVVETAVQWVVYEELKYQMGHRTSLHPDKQKKSKSASDWLEILGCSGTAKLIAALIAYPHEVLRTRLRQNPTSGQFKYTGLIQASKLILKEEGIRGFYGGLTPHLLRVVPNAIVLFGTYEGIMHYFGNNH